MKKLILSLLAFAAFTGIEIKASGILYNVGSRDITVFQVIPGTGTKTVNKKGTQYSLPANKSIHVPASGQYKISWGMNGYLIDFDTKTISMVNTPQVVYNFTDDIYINSTSNDTNAFMNSTQYAAKVQGEKLTVYNINQNSMNCLYIAGAGSTTFTTIIPGQSCTATNPGTYFICTSSNGTGPALSLTYANTNAHTPTTISSCYLQNGKIISGSQPVALPPVPNTGKISISSENGWVTSVPNPLPSFVQNGLSVGLYSNQPVWISDNNGNKYDSITNWIEIDNAQEINIYASSSYSGAYLKLKPQASQLQGSNIMVNAYDAGGKSFSLSDLSYPGINTNSIQINVGTGTSANPSGITVTVTA